MTFNRLTDEAKAACWGIEAIACIRLGLADEARERAIHAVRAAARAEAYKHGGIADVARQTLREE